MDKALARHHQHVQEHVFDVRGISVGAPKGRHHRRRGAPERDQQEHRPVRCNIGVVSQTFDWFAHMTTVDNITLAPMKVRKVKARDASGTAMALLERVGIPEQGVPAAVDG